MGSKQSQKTSSVFDKLASEEVTGIDELQRQFGQNFSNLNQLFQNRISQPINLDFQQAFSDKPEAIVQNLISRGVQNIKASQSAGQQALASQLNRLGGGGDTSRLLAVLNAQGDIASRGAQNALIPAALQEQRNQDIARAQITAQQNAQRLAQRAQEIQDLAPGLSLLNQLNQMAGISKGRRVRQTGFEDSRSSGSKGFF